MADRPILFSAPMVRALLDGRKTQTRRILKPQPTINSAGLLVWENGPDFIQGPRDDIAGGQRIKAGDRLWVKEAFRAQEEFDHLSPRAIVETFETEIGFASFPTFYEADRKCDDWSIEIWQQSPPGRLRASMHMPRCASRLTCTVTEVRVERLQDINRGDAMEEGCQFPNMASGPDPRLWFRSIWTDINGTDAWEVNPFVVAYTFTVECKNIDEASR